MLWCHVARPREGLRCGRRGNGECRIHCGGVGGHCVDRLRVAGRLTAVEQRRPRARRTQHSRLNAVHEGERGLRVTRARRQTAPLCRRCWGASPSSDMAPRQHHGDVTQCRRVSRATRSACSACRRWLQFRAQCAKQQPRMCWLPPGKRRARGSVGRHRGAPPPRPPERHTGRSAARRASSRGSAPRLRQIDWHPAVPCASRRCCHFATRQ